MAKKLPDTVKALRDFNKAMTDCEKECDKAIIAVHEGEDPFWDALWKHEKAFCLLVGAGGALGTIALIFALHLSRGGQIF